MVTERAQKAIDKLAEERAAFIAWVRRVPDDEWSSISPDGMWQARDYVAHLASIDPLLTGLVRIFQSAGAPPPTGSDGRPFSIDDWNEVQILGLRDRSIDSLIDDMEKFRVDLNAALAGFTDEQLDKTFHFGGDKSRSPRDVQVGQFLSGVVYHDRWHMEDARRCIERETEQAFGDAAFESMLKGKV